MARGRKEGSSSGKRPIFWVCISNKNQLIVEKVYSPDSSSDEDVSLFTSDKASKIFKETYKVEPDKIIGPCYDVKSLNKNNSVKFSKEKEVTINNSNTTISSVLGLGHYNGWTGTVFSISGKNDEVLFIASARLDSNHNIILPPAAPIKKELVSFI